MQYGFLPTISQKQAWSSISGTSMCTEARARTHAHRHWLRKGTHTVSRVCVALCVVARAMKQNHSRRKVHFAQRTLNCTTDTQAVKFQSRFLSFPTAEHIAFKPKSKTRTLSKAEKLIVMKVLFFHLRLILGNVQKILVKHSYTCILDLVYGASFACIFPLRANTHAYTHVIYVYINHRHFLIYTNFQSSKGCQSLSQAQNWNSIKIELLLEQASWQETTSSKIPAQKRAAANYWH